MAHRRGGIRAALPIHSHRRTERTHCPDRRLGVGQGMRATRAMATGSRAVGACFGEYLGTAARARATRERGRRAGAQGRHRCESAALRDHRERRDAELATVPGCPAGPAPARLAHPHRRFRHRLFEPELSQEPSRRYPQNRPRVRARHGAGYERCRYRSRHRRSGQEPGPADRRRRDRVRGAAGGVAQTGLRVRPGVLLESAGVGGSVRKRTPAASGSKRGRGGAEAAPVESDLRKTMAATKRQKNPRSSVLREQAEEAVRTLLRWAGDDPTREGLLDTPKRVVNAYRDWFSGYDIDPADYLRRTFEE